MISGVEQLVDTHSALPAALNYLEDGAAVPGSVPVLSVHFAIAHAA